jgi:hypothetical protein
MRHEHTHIYGICKVNAGPFARAFPSADFYAVDQHYSNPILPPALTPTLTPPPTLTLALAPTPNPNPNQVDQQYSFPVPLPSLFLGLPPWTKPLPRSSQGLDLWGGELEHEVPAHRHAEPWPQLLP